ncbi:hypothetical protein XA68_11051 [Ophiocordyceps unilateralis]|uniref:Uncharacterized protein n=1 Tax=Ophiocordyceps unilateralis TaxID=268505 RepID=A0A2A9PGC1_OPHUN|nr:hypothetical protein XA68_11051 [Ophiocordyceps unilateralis]
MEILLNSSQPQPSSLFSLLHPPPPFAPLPPLNQRFDADADAAITSLSIRLSSLLVTCVDWLSPSRTELPRPRLPQFGSRSESP